MHTPLPPLAVRDIRARLQTALTHQDFLKAARQVALAGTIAPADTVKLLQVLANRYQNSGFADFAAVQTLTQQFPRLSLHQQVSALQSLARIRPKSNSKELYSLLSTTVTALSQSKLHEVKTESLGQLLDLACDLRLGSQELWQYCVDRILQSSFPAGVLEGAFLVQVLRAASDLQFDLNSLQSLLISAVSLKSAGFQPLSRCFLALYLARLHLFEPLCRLLPDIVAKPVVITRKSANLLHSALLGLDILAPKGLISAANAEIPHFPAFRSSLQASVALYAQQPAANCLSPLHRDVLAALARLGIAHQAEITLPAPSFLPVDVAIEGSSRLVEVQGPTHYLYSSERPTGATVYKAELLQGLGFSLLQVPYFLWNRQDCKEEYMRRVLEVGRL